MTTELLFAAAAWLTTYAVHSTLLLAAAWSLDRRGRITSFAFRETLWKAAAVAPLFTTALTCLGGWSQPVTEFALASPPTVSRAAAEWPNDADAVSLRPEPRVVGEPETGEFSATFAEIEVPLTQGSGPLIVAPEDAEPNSTVIKREQRSESPAQSLESTPKIAARDPGIVRQADDASSQRGETRRVNGVSIAFAVLSPVSMLFLLAGVSVCSLRMVRLIRRYGDSELSEAGPGREALDRLCRTARIRRRVRLRSCRRSLDPVAFGLFRWTIVLPTDSPRLLTPKQLEALLAHELAHLVRGDVVWLWIGQVLCTCFAWQPLNFLARRRWQAAAEYQCDDWAVERGVEPLSLAACLTEVASWRMEGATPTAALSAAGPSSEVGRRIRRLAEGAGRDRWRCKHRGGLLRFAMVALTVLFGWWAPRAVWSVAATPTSTAEHSAASASAITKRSATALSPNETSFGRSAGDADVLSEWRELNRELRQLHDAIEQLPAAAKQSAEPRVTMLVDELRQRAARLESRRIRLIDRLGDADASPADSFFDEAFSDVNVTTP